MTGHGIAHRSTRRPGSPSLPVLKCLGAALLLPVLAGCGEGGDVDAAADPDEVVELDEEHLAVSAHELEPDSRDMEGIRDRGTLRVLVPSTEEAYLPRQGTPRSQEQDLARRFAEDRGLDVQFVLVPDHDRLIPMLLEGKGDVVAAQLTVTERRTDEADFTWPLFSADEVLVGRRGRDDLPTSAEELDGHEVHVRAGSSYFETLSAIAEEEAPDLEIVPVPEHLDTESIVYEVSVGERPLTVVDSHLLSAIEAYNEDLQRLATLERGREIAWAVRPENPELRSSLDAFLVENALRRHAEERFTGDLDGIRERGALRVITRNNPVTYFLQRGRPHGFDYTLARMLADALDVRLEMVVPPSRDELIPWLLEGRGDIIAASLTVTSERAEEVAFSEPYLYVDEVVVGPADGPRLESVEDLAEHPVHVRPGSSYARTLRDLDEELDVDLRVEDASEALETYQLVGQVARGEIPLTVVDTHIFQVERAYRTEIRPLFQLSAEPGEDPPAPRRVGIEGEREIAFAMRPDAHDLRDFVDGFVEDVYRGLEYNEARRRYFQEPRSTQRASENAALGENRLSPYDDLIQRYSRRYGLDWRLMAALAYQESRFNPYAESWMGAVGLFQIMPRTGRALGFENLRDPEVSTHAGTLYFHYQASQLDPALPFDERLRFALAAYNAGRGHVNDARRLAAQKGMDPDRWFGNVEEAMLLLMRPEYHRQARHGFVRGTEPVNYVQQIQNRYDNYVHLFSP